MDDFSYKNYVKAGYALAVYIGNMIPLLFLGFHIEYVPFWSFYTAMIILIFGSIYKFYTYRRYMRIERHEYVIETCILVMLALIMFLVATLNSKIVINDNQVTYIKGVNLMWFLSFIPVLIYIRSNSIKRKKYIRK